MLTRRAYDEQFGVHMRCCTHMMSLAVIDGLKDVTPQF